MGYPDTAQKTTRPGPAAVAEARDYFDAESVKRRHELSDIIWAAARRGDMAAAKLLVDRIWPQRRGPVVKFSMRKMKTAEDCSASIDALIQQAADGLLTLSEAGEIAKLIEAKLRALQEIKLHEQLGVLGRRVADMLAVRHDSNGAHCRRN